jgi:hypothetical protein
MRPSGRRLCNRKFAGRTFPHWRQAGRGGQGAASQGYGPARLPSHVFSPGVAYSPAGLLLATSGPELYSADSGRRLWPASIVAGPPMTDLGTGFELLMRVSDGSVLEDLGTALPRHPSFSPDGAWIAASSTAPRNARLLQFGRGP